MTGKKSEFHERTRAAARATQRCGAAFTQGWWLGLAMALASCGTQAKRNYAANELLLAADSGVCEGGDCTSPSLTCELPASTLCAGECIDTLANGAHCGGCGEACSDGLLCVAGECQSECGGAFPTQCGDQCVNLRTNGEHCGQCGTACGDNELCSGGRCEMTCGADTPNVCGGLCVNLQSDTQHCGDCDSACPQGAVCVEGKCDDHCQGSKAVQCGDVCVDTRTDPRFCGSCDNACAAGEVCNDGVCALGCSDSAASWCDGLCVDLAWDPNACGVCGVGCEPNSVCKAGQCAQDCEGTGRRQCGDRCVDADNDPLHCGACGTTCAPGEVCSSGQCSSVCGGETPVQCGNRCFGLEDAPFGSCDLSCPSDTPDACDVGCVDLASDHSNCGECSRRCNAENECIGGRCLAEDTTPSAPSSASSVVVLSTAPDSITLYISADVSTSHSTEATGIGDAQVLDQTSELVDAGTEAGTSQPGNDTEPTSSVTSVYDTLPAVTSDSVNSATDTPTVDVFDGFCGDGVTDTELGEACDTLVDTQECVAAACQFTVCGDQTIHAASGEQCDTLSDTNLCNGASAGTLGCKAASCGDGYRNGAAGEQCDSLSLPTSDCDADCTRRSCGDGYTNTAAGEQCDVSVDTSSCNGVSAGTRSCLLARCGDGYRNATAGESCDNGASNSDVTPGACLTNCGGYVPSPPPQECVDGQAINCNRPDGSGSYKVCTNGVWGPCI